MAPPQRPREPLPAPDPVEEAEARDRRLHAETPLIAAEDWEGLVRHRRRTLDLLPDSLDALLDLAEAHLAAGGAEAALELLTTYHRQAPDCPDGQDLILDALFSLGRSEDDFAWVERPSVWHLETGALDRCRELLVGAAPATAGDLYHDLLEEAYPAFSMDELAAALRGDPRFGVVGTNGKEAGPWREIFALERDAEPA